MNNTTDLRQKFEDLVALENKAGLTPITAFGTFEEFCAEAEGVEKLYDLIESRKKYASSMIDWQESAPIQPE